MLDTRKLTRAITYLRAMLEGLITDETLTGLCPRSLNKSGAHQVQLTADVARCIRCNRHSAAAEFSQQDTRTLSTGHDMVLVSLLNALHEPQPCWIGERLSTSDGVARVRVLVELDVFIAESHLTTLTQVPGAERTVLRVARVMRESGDD